MGTVRAACLAVALLLVVAGLAAAAPTARTPGFGGVARVVATSPPTAPAPLELSANGTRPDVLVDAAGTAHVVWNEPGGDAADITVYCRLPRAARACETTHRLVPPGADRYSVDSEGPEVVAVNDQIAILSFRYPQTVPKPGNARQDSTLWLWTSDDGGQAFVGPGMVGVGSVGGGAAAFGPVDAPSIAAVTGVVTGGVTVTSIPGGSFVGGGALVAPGDFFAARVAVAGGIPSVAYQDLPGTSYVRTWSGRDDPNDPGTWLPARSFPGIDPGITAAAGRILLTVEEAVGGRLLLHDLAGGTSIPLNTGRAGNASIPIGHPDGTVSVVWQGAEGNTSGVWRRERLVPGVRPSGAPTLVSTAPVLFSEADATDDGGGVVVSDTVERRVLLSAFGNRAPTGRPGLGGRAGGGALGPDVAVACQRVRFGPVEALLQDGCFLSAASGGAKVSRGPLRLNGLDIVPDAGVQVQIDPRARTISSTGTVSVLLRAPGIPDITLFRGVLRVDARGRGPGASLFSFADGVFRPRILGFPVTGGVDVRLTAAGVRIPISLRLPAAFGSVRGAAELVADNRRGLVIDSLDFSADGVPLGAATLRRLDVQYRAAGGTTTGDCLRPATSGAPALPDEWAGVFELELPPPRSGPALCGSIRFGDGSFRGATFRIDLPYPGIVLFPGISLTSLGGGLSLTPAQIAATARIEAISAARGASLLILDGSLTARLASPLTLTGESETFVAGVRVGRGTYTVSADGYAALRVDAGLEVGSLAVRQRIAGFLDGPRGAFSLSGAGEACLAGACLSGSEAVVSTRGVAVCLPSVPRGGGYRWGEPVIGGVEIWLLNCYAGRYEIADARAAERRAHQAGVGGAGADVAGGAPDVTFRVRGEGGVPAVELIGPGGSAVAPDADVADAGAATRYLAVRRPAAGRWTLRALPGSPAIVELAAAPGLARPRVTGAVVTGRGRARALRYRALLGAGQSVTFVERGRAGTRVLGAGRAGARRLTFTPGPGPGGRRRIVALFAQDGLVREEVTVTSYVAPPPLRAGRARGLQARRAGARVILTWRPGPAAAAQRVVASAGPGRSISLYLGPRARRAVLTGLAPRARVRATVTAVARDGRAGPPARIVVAARR